MNQSIKNLAIARENFDPGRKNNPIYVANFMLTVADAVLATAADQSPVVKKTLEELSVSEADSPNAPELSEGAEDLYLKNDLSVEDLSLVDPTGASGNYIKSDIEKILQKKSEADSQDQDSEDSQENE